MKKYNKNIPEGNSDIIFGDTLYIKKAVENFNGVYKRFGFREIMTPTTEFYDVFDFEEQPIPQEMMYKTVDNSGKLLVLRPDNTTPILRVISTKLKDELLPVKVFYNQNVFRINTDYSGRKSEQIQSGVEIIGTNGIKTDLFFLEAALSVLDSIKLDYKLEIGHTGFYKAMLDGLGLDELEKETVNKYISSKNAGDADFLLSGNIDDNAYNIIRKIPRLFGGSEVFAEAEKLAGNNKKALDELAYIKTLYNIINTTSFRDKIIIDLGIVHEFDYYTGLVVNGYIDSVGESILSGGRYDGLLDNFGSPMPATGFALNINLIAKALSAFDRRFEGNRYNSPEAVIFYETQNFGRAMEFISENADKIIEVSCFETLAETVQYCKTRKIDTIIKIEENNIEYIKVAL